MNLLVDYLKSPLGILTVVWKDDALRALEFEDHNPRLQRLLEAQYGEYRLRPERLGSRLITCIQAYFEGELKAIETIPVQTNGTAFQQQVWAALRQISVGTTISYAELANRIGRPRACRAVGLANGSNPVAIVVPCHRVIGANGALTGYGGGIDRKRWLLQHERAYSNSSSKETATPQLTLQNL